MKCHGQLTIARSVFKNSKNNGGPHHSTEMIVSVSLKTRWAGQVNYDIIQLYCYEQTLEIQICQ